jgi:hypothetical protein
LNSTKEKLLLNELENLLATNQTSSLYSEFIFLQDDFIEMFKKYVPDEIINADFDTYVAYIFGLASGGIRNKLNDAMERFTIKNRLEKSFFDWFPKYRFLERFDLSKYHGIFLTISTTDQLRKKMVELINIRDKGENF